MRTGWLDDFCFVCLSNQLDLEPESIKYLKGERNFIFITIIIFCII